MSHTGNRFNRNIASGMIDEVINNPRPKRIPAVTLEEHLIEKGGVLDGHELVGEFAGNGSTVLVGLSTSEILDLDNVLNDDQKGVVIGYTPTSAYFHLFRNDGAGSKVTTILDNRFKDTDNHKFEITIKSGKLLIKFDGAEDTITTKIPSINDTLYIVSYGVY